MRITRSSKLSEPEIHEMAPGSAGVEDQLRLYLPVAPDVISSASDTSGCSPSPSA